MVLNQQQRDVLRAKAMARVREVEDDQLVAWLVLLGYTLDEIDQFLKDFA